MMCIELNKEMIEKTWRLHVVNLPQQYNRSTSAICTILKQKKMKKVIPAKRVKIVFKQWTSIHENMKKLLIVWLMEKQLVGVENK